MYLKLIIAEKTTFYAPKMKRSPMKTETEVGVMLLLVFAAFIEDPLAPYMEMFAGWLAFIPGVVNGVLLGAIYPASGDVWLEVLILSTAVLVTPISSLVGIMLFKTWDEWIGYMKISFRWTAVWAIVAGIWFLGAWPHLEDVWYNETGFNQPHLEEVAHVATATGAKGCPPNEAH